MEIQNGLMNDICTLRTVLFNVVHGGHKAETQKLDTVQHYLVLCNDISPSIIPDDVDSEEEVPLNESNAGHELGLLIKTLKRQITTSSDGSTEDRKRLQRNATIIQSIIGAPIKWTE
jgi:hypothetical protein